MKLTFTEEDPDETLEELSTILGFVEVEIAQYFVESDESLEDFDFGNPTEYRTFFSQFADYANPLWNSRMRGDWDFSKVPYRYPSDIIKGVYRILRTGGAYSGAGKDANALGKVEALEVEGRLRAGFQKNANSLHIFCIVEFTHTNDAGSSFLVDMASYDQLGDISQFFNRIAWDDLIFIINPQYNTLYVIAFTDTD
jgi:hypothetical protein